MCAVSRERISTRSSAPGLAGRAASQACGPCQRRGGNRWLVCEAAVIGSSEAIADSARKTGDFMEGRGPTYWCMRLGSIRPYETTGRLSPEELYAVFNRIDDAARAIWRSDIGDSARFAARRRLALTGWDPSLSRIQRDGGAAIRWRDP